MFTAEFLKSAKKDVKMIAMAIIDGIVSNQLIIKFDYEGETIEVFHHVGIIENKLTLNIHRDGVNSYSLHGFNNVVSIKEMASDIFFLLAMPCVEVKI